MNNSNLAPGNEYETHGDPQVDFHASDSGREHRPHGMPEARLAEDTEPGERALSEEEEEEENKFRSRLKKGKATGPPPDGPPHLEKYANTCQSESYSTYLCIAHSSLVASDETDEESRIKDLGTSHHHAHYRTLDLLTYLLGFL